MFQEKKKKYEPPIPTRVGKKKKKMKGPDAASKLPQGTYVIHWSGIQLVNCIFLNPSKNIMIQVQWKVTQKNLWVDKKFI